MYLTYMYVSIGGAKQYGLKIFRESTGKFYYIVKLRGVTLNHSAYKVLASEEDPEAMFDYDDDDEEEMTEGQLTEAVADAVAVADNGDQEDVELQSKAYEHLKTMVMAYGRQHGAEEDVEEVGKSVTFQYNSIRAQRLGGVHSFTTSKTYNPVILNAVVHKDYNVFPYGYNGPNT